MQLTFAPKGILQIDDARIIFRNFAGRADKFNREGDRNFTLVIPSEEICEALVNDTNEHGVGWNVRIKPPREDGDEPFMTLKVKVKFNNRGPNVYLISGDKKVKLDEDSIDCLDDIYISNVRLDIRPYDDVVSGKPFRAAYLHGMEVTQDVTDRFAAGYGDDTPFDA